MPKHVGVIDLTAPLTAHFSRSQGNQNLTKIDLYMQVSNKGVLSRACFKTNGNPFIIASLEWLCRQSEGRPLDEIAAFNYQVLIKELAIPLHQSPIAVLVADVYKEVLALIHKKFEGYTS